MCVLLAEDQNRFMHGDCLAGFDQDCFYESTTWGFYFKCCLVGFNLKKNIPAADLIVDLDETINNCPFLHCLSKLRQPDNVCSCRRLDGC